MNEDEGLHLEDATVASEVITLENKDKFHFIVDELEKIFLKKRYGEMSVEEMATIQKSIADSSQEAFDQMILAHPKDLFKLFITNREKMEMEFEASLGFFLSENESQMAA